MIGAGLMMGGNARANSVQVTPGDDCIDQPITALAFTVVFRESQAQEVVGVVWQREINFQEAASDLPRLGRISLDYNRLLDA